MCSVRILEHYGVWNQVINSINRTTRTFELFLYQLETNSEWELLRMRGITRDTAVRQLIETIVQKIQVHSDWLNAKA